MGRIFSVSVTAGALAMMWVVASASSGNTKVRDLKQLAEAAGLSGNVYRMSSMDGGSCLVTRSAKLFRDASQLTVEPACEGLLPGMSRVRYWRDRRDGTVEFTGEAGDALAVFAIGDGVDYESFRPRAPLLSLSSQG